MATDLLYYTDSYLRSFTSEITAVDEGGTHVASTREIGHVRVLAATSKGKPTSAFASQSTALAINRAITPIATPKQRVGSLHLRALSETMRVGVA
jgi:hypothetical protein